MFKEFKTMNMKAYMQPATMVLPIDADELMKVTEPISSGSLTPSEPGQGAPQRIDYLRI